MRILAKNKDENKKQHIFTIELDTSEENKDLIDEVVYALLFAQESKLENFYWEYEMTDTENEDSVIKVKMECPQPKEGLFEEPYDPETVEGDYAKYWVKKLKESTENYEYKAAIQKKEIVFPGTRYVNQEGEVVEVEESRISNNDIGDITNLLGLF
jgi:hypothetical protein